MSLLTAPKDQTEQLKNKPPELSMDSVSQAKKADDNTSSNKRMLASIMSLAKYSRSAETSIFGLGLRYVLNRRYGNRILAASGTRIDHPNNLKVHKLLQIGMINPGFVNANDQTYLNLKGKLEILGFLSIARGCRVYVAEGASLTVGSGFVNSNSKFVVHTQMTVGNDCAISWDCSFIDTNLHDLDYVDKETERRGIVIGSNIWIGAGVKVLAGAIIPDGSVVAAGSIVNKAFYEPGVLLAGVPAKVVRKGVRWRL